MQISDKRNLKIYMLLIGAVFLNVGIWLYSHKLYVKWTNIPEPPKAASINTTFLSDPSLSYRIWGLALQNFGSVGKSQALKDYNFKFLSEWFFLLDGMDPQSKFVPFLAAYYFSATQNAAQLPPLINYLETVGMRPGAYNWRWLAEAAFLARHRLKDMDEALRIARKLGSIYKPPMPAWTRNMEPMLRADMGDKDAAYLLALEILKSNGPQMSNSEYNSTVTMICQSILTKAQATKSPLCPKPE